MKKYCYIGIGFLLALSGCSSGSTWIYEDFPEDTDYALVWEHLDATFVDVKKGDLARGTFFYDDASPFYDGIALVQRDGAYTYIDKNFDPINGEEYDDAGIFSEGIALTVKKFGKITAINARGKEIFTLDMAEEAYPFREGVSVIKDRNGKYGAVNTRGKIVIKPRYDKLGPFAYHGLLSASIGEKEGVVNVSGEEVIPCIYHKVTLDKNSGLIGLFTVTDEQGNEGIVDSKNKFIIPISEKNGRLIPEKGGLINQIKDERYGWLDTSGKPVIPARFSETGLFYGNKFTWAVENEHDVLINRKGERLRTLPHIVGIYPIDENGIWQYYDSEYGTRSFGGKWSWGMINRNGEVIVPVKYSSLRYLGNAVYLGRNGMESLDVLDAKGNIKKQIFGNYSLYNDDSPIGKSPVRSQYVDVGAIMSSLSLLLDSLRVGVLDGPGTLIRKYGLDEYELVPGNNVLTVGRENDYMYTFAVNLDRTNAIRYYELTIELTWPSRENSHICHNIINRIGESFAPEGNPQPLPGFEHCRIAFNDKYDGCSFRMTPDPIDWITGIWCVLFENGKFVELNIDMNNWDVTSIRTKPYNSEEIISGDGSESFYYEVVGLSFIDPKRPEHKFTVNLEEKTLYYNDTDKMTKVSNEAHGEYFDYEPIDYSAGIPNFR